MKKLFAKFLIALACILNIGDAQAQEIWTLEQCINHAIKNNLQIKQANFAVENSYINLEQSKFSIFPNLNAFASNYYNYGKTIDPFTNSFATEKVRSDRYGLQSNLTLFNGFQNYNNIQQNKLNLLASKYDAEKVISDISLYVASAYLQVLFAMELLDISNQQLLLTKAQVERTKKLVEAGSIAKGSLLTMESQQASEELAVVNAQNNIDNSYLNLAQLLELEDIKNFNISRPVISSVEQTELQESVQSIYETALKNRPEIMSAELKLRSSKKGISIAKASLSPQLSMSGSYGTGYSGLSKRLVGDPVFGVEPTGYYTTSNEAVLGPVLLNSFEKTPFSKQINDNVNKSFGINLSIPIFNGFQAKSSISKAKIAYSTAELKLESEQKNLYKTIQQSYTDAQAALKKLTATQKAIDALRESFNYSEQRFVLGMLNSLDYNDAKIKLTKAESDYIQAKYDFIFKRNILNFYQGKPIAF